MESQIIEDIANLLQSVQHNSKKTAALAILLFLVSCDAEDKQTSAEIAVRWLNDYASRISETPEFRISPIRLAEQSKTIDMDVVITNPLKARDLRGRSRVQQLKILQLICPPAREDIWRLLGDDLALRINIAVGEGKTISGGCISR